MRFTSCNLLTARKQHKLRSRSMALLLVRIQAFLNRVVLDVTTITTTDIDARTFVQKKKKKRLLCSMYDCKIY
jgi:hypothetical protein